MTERYCLRCGKKFVVTSHNKYYCSKKCMEINTRKRLAERTFLKKCKWCGTYFPGTAKTDYCSSDCKAKDLARLEAQKRCEKCIYSCRLHQYELICDYINIVGHSRGCEALGCKRFRRK